MPPRTSEEEKLALAQASSSAFLQDLDFDAFVEENEDELQTYKKPLAPKTVRSRVWHDGFFKAFLELWIQHPNQQKMGIAKDVETVLQSTLILPKIFWLFLAAACCRKRAVRARHDIDGTEAKVEKPYAQSTAESRLSSCILSHNRLRQNVPKVDTKISSLALTSIRDPASVRKNHLQPSRDFTKEFCTYDNVIAFLSAALSTAAASCFRCARERIQFFCFTVILFFSGARPGDIVPAAGYGESFGLKWKDVEIFAHKVAGKMVLGIRLTIRNLKGMKGNQNKYRRVVLNSKHNVPSAADPAYLIAALALEDEVLDGVTKPAHLDVGSLSEEALDPFTKRCDFTIKAEKRETLIFRSVVRSSENATFDWVISDVKEWNTDLAWNTLARIRRFSFPSLTWYTMRRMAATLTNRADITDEDRKLGMGHTTGSTMRSNAYLSKTAAYDLMGIAVDGEQDRDSVAWTGLPVQNPNVAKLTDAEEAELRLEPQLVAAASIVERLHDEMLEGGKENATSARARNTSAYLTYSSASSRYSGLLASMRREKQAEKVRLDTASRQKIALDQLHNMEEDPIAEETAGVETDEVEVDSETLDEHFAELRSRKAEGEQHRASKTTTAVGESVAEKMQAIRDAAPSHPERVRRLQDLVNEVRTSFSLDVPDHGKLLLKGEDKLCFSQAYDLLSQQYGTKESKRPKDKCDNCDKVFTIQLLTDRYRHIVGCVKASLEKSLSGKCLEHHKSIGCPIQGCPTVWKKQEHDRLTLVKHFYKQHRDRKECNFELPDGSKCTFEIGDTTLESLDAALLSMHQECSHGWPSTLEPLVHYDEDCNTYNIGVSSVQLFCAAKLPAKGESLTSMQVSRPSNACPFCFLDDKLAPFERLREHQSLPEHLFVSHLFSHDDKYDCDDELIQCPCCLTTVAIWEFFVHLDRAKVLCKQRGAKGNIEDLDAIRRPPKPGQVGRFNTFIAWAKDAKASHQKAGTSPLTDGVDRVPCELKSVLRINTSSKYGHKRKKRQRSEDVLLEGKDVTDAIQPNVSPTISLLSATPLLTEASPSTPGLETPIADFDLSLFGIDSLADIIPQRGGQQNAGLGLFTDASGLDNVTHNAASNLFETGTYQELVNDQIVTNSVLVACDHWEVELPRFGGEATVEQLWPGLSAEDMIQLQQSFADWMDPSTHSR